LPRLNFTPNARPYRDFYQDDRDLERVRSSFREESEAFDYDFSGSNQRLTARE